MTDESIEEVEEAEVGEVEGEATPAWPVPQPTRRFEVDQHGEVGIKQRIAGREYSLDYNSQCKTCRSPYIAQIHTGLLRSYGYTAILKDLPEDHNLTAENLSHHLRNHVPLKEAVKRRIQEEHAKEMGLDIEGFEGALANYLTLGKMVVQDVLEQFVDGEIKPGWEEAVAFSRLQFQAEAVAGADADQQMFNDAMLGFLEAVQAVVTPEQLQRIFYNADRNSLIQGVQNRLARQSEVIDLD